MVMMRGARGGRRARVCRCSGKAKGRKRRTLRVNKGARGIQLSLITQASIGPTLRRDVIPLETLAFAININAQSKADGFS